jgi:hypothetical protein
VKVKVGEEERLMWVESKSKTLTDLDEANEIWNSEFEPEVERVSIKDLALDFDESHLIAKNGKSLKFTKQGLSQFLSQVKIPMRYATAVPQDLLQHDFDRLKGELTDPRFFLLRKPTEGSDHSTVISVQKGTPRIRCRFALEAFEKEKVSRVILKDGFANLFVRWIGENMEEADISPHANLAETPVGGGRIAPAWSIDVNEIKAPSMLAKLATWTFVCSNGVTVPGDMFNVIKFRRPVGVLWNEVFDSLKGNLEHKETQELLMQMKDHYTELDKPLEPSKRMKVWKIISRASGDFDFADTCFSTSVENRDEFFGGKENPPYKGTVLDVINDITKRAQFLEGTRLYQIQKAAGTIMGECLNL